MSDSISPLSNAMITHDSLVIEWFLPGSTRYPHHPEPRGDPSRANQRLGTNLTLELGSKEKRPENSNMNVKICRWIDICICMDLFQTRPGESFPGVKQLSFSRHFFGPVSRSPAPKGRGKNSGANRKPVSGVDFPPVTLSLSLSAALIFCSGQVVATIIYLGILGTHFALLAEWPPKAFYNSSDPGWCWARQAGWRPAHCGRVTM